MWTLSCFPGLMSHKSGINMTTLVLTLRLMQASPDTQEMGWGTEYLCTLQKLSLANGSVLFIVLLSSPLQSSN
jgi:hypothetical protein